MKHRHPASRIARPCGRVFRSAFAALALLSMIVASGCGSKNTPETEATSVESTMTGEMKAAIASEEAQDELVALVNDFENAIRDASATMQRQLKSRDAREAAQQWPGKVSSVLNAKTAEQDHVVQLIEVWGTLRRHDEYLRSGAGATIFADQQKTATDLSGTYLTRYRDFVRKYLPEKEYTELQALVEAYAKQHPVTGTFNFEVQGAAMSLAGQGLGALTGLAGIGIGAVEAVASPVTSTLDLPTQVGRLVDVLDDLPRDIFVNLETTAQALLTTEQIVSLVESVERFSVTGERFASVAETLPEDIQVVVAKTLEESVAVQPELRMTIEQVESLVGALQGVVAQVESTLVETQKLTVAVGDLAERTKAPEPAVPTPTPFPPTGPPRPFDITEYNDAIKSVSQTLVEVQGIVTEVRGLVESESVEAGLVDVKNETKAAIALTHEQIVALTNKIFGLAFALIGFFFGVLLVYRILASRLVARKAKAE